MLLALLLGTATAAPLPCGFPLFGPPALRVPEGPPVPADGELEERDAYGEFPNSLASEHFVVKWGSVGNVEEEDVEVLLAAFEQTWEVQITEMEHPPPPGADTWRFNVYIGDTGSGTPDGYGTAGYYTADPDGYPMLVISRDTLYDLAYAEVTAAHEFYHAVQSGLGTYGYSGDAAWYWEATAEWASGEVYPENDYTAIFLFGYAFLPHLSVNYFDYPDTGALQEYHQYGAFIFPTFLSEHVADWSLIRDSWVEGGSRDPLEVLDGLLAGYGTSVSEVYPTFAAHNATWDYENGDAYEYMLDYYARWYGADDHRVAVELPAEGTDALQEAPEETLPQRYGYNLLRLEEPPEGVAVFEFQGEAEGSEGSPAAFGVTLVSSTGADLSYTPLTLSEQAGTGRVRLTGEERELFAVVAAIPADAEDEETFGYAWRLRWEEPADTGGEDTGGGAETADTVGETDEEERACGCASGGAGGSWGALVALALGLARARRAAATTGAGRG